MSCGAHVGIGMGTHKFVLNMQRKEHENDDKRVAWRTTMEGSSKRSEATHTVLPVVAAKLFCLCIAHITDCCRHPPARDTFVSAIVLRGFD